MCCIEQGLYYQSAQKLKSYSIWIIDWGKFNDDIQCMKHIYNAEVQKERVEEIVLVGGSVCSVSAFGEGAHFIPLRQIIHTLKGIV
jgi:hypothetical protein